MSISNQPSCIMKHATIVTVAIILIQLIVYVGMIAAAVHFIRKWW